MRNWGIPDWLDASSYGDTALWSENRWHWEFVRRRQDCRNDFLAFKDETLKSLEEGVETERSRRPNRSHFLRPDEPGFVAEVPDCYKKYGLHNLPNPAIGDQPFYVILFPSRAVGRVMFPEDGIEAGVFGATDAVIAFDLTCPVPQLLEDARQLLESAQKRKIGRLVQSSKRHPSKWLIYLRVLDAKESGASLSKIAGSDVLDGRRQDAQAARDVLKQAEALCFKWPD